MSRVNSRVAVWELLLFGEGDLVEEEPDSSIDVVVAYQGKLNGMYASVRRVCTDNHAFEWDDVRGWIQKAVLLQESIVQQFTWQHLFLEERNRPDTDRQFRPDDTVTRTRVDPELDPAFVVWKCVRDHIEEAIWPVQAYHFNWVTGVQ